METQKCKNPECAEAMPQPLSNFGKSKRHKTGYNTTCKACVARRFREYRATPKGKEATRLATTKYAKSNKDVSTAKSQRYRERHPDTIKKYSKEYYNTNKEIILAKHKTPEYRKSAALRQRKYRLENPELAKMRYQAWEKSDAGKAWRRASNTARKLKKKGLFVETIKKDVLWERDAGVCQRCRIALNYLDQWHLDHIWPLARNGLHMYANAQVLCPSCNCSKKDSIPTVWEMLKVYKRMISK